MKISKLQLIYLSILSMLGFIATDMYLPAFKLIEQDFSTGPEQIALSLTVFLVGMGLGQFVWGLASDRFGHRKTLFAGLAIFSIASIGLAWSQEVWQLLSLRMLQAVGVCAPAVIWQSMVIDKFDKKTSQQIFATIMPLVALSPALAPQLGVLLTELWGWHSIFVVLAITGALLAAVTLSIKDHTSTKKKSTSVSADLKSLIGSRDYVGNVLMYAVASAAFFAYLTGMPEIMSQLGYSGKEIGLSFIPQTIAFMVGGYMGKKLVAKLGDETVLKQLLGLETVAILLVFVACQWQLTTVWPILAPFCLLAVANGALYPIVVNRALSSAPHCSATAAGLQNSIQIGISSLASALVATFAIVAQTAVGYVILGCLALMWLGYLIATPALTNELTIPDNSRVVNDE
ncbi:Bcr/CflA family multidrug efflux transporter [Vibrio sp. 10N.286.49.C2]|uniref:purine nucleoside transporter PunC n=1 Tax=unclassified Vibrio TaxID=2614977 RepID=UPI000C841FF9|nr:MULTISPECIES: purine nucleoside transporter PunC [unclassified Vibrio]PMH36504.1 Bcr/CflA family multidrug efflux transporter [Vibrio sp. 10N.286.49.C2]PMH52408.1 Bcr/CflA family multidrug efflux transporter [Vibrio sp. 10N.286.49.B1]PMH81899.1 Bcr/CflA family multidrug efflux transporter [Vibrio sp. 10N.286.48.B7]